MTLCSPIPISGHRPRKRPGLVRVRSGLVRAERFLSNLFFVLKSAYYKDVVRVVRVVRVDFTLLHTCAPIVVFLFLYFSFIKKHSDHIDQTRKDGLLHPDHSHCPPLTTLTKRIRRLFHV